AILYDAEEQDGSEDLEGQDRYDVGWVEIESDDLGRAQDDADGHRSHQQGDATGGSEPVSARSLEIADVKGVGDARRQNGTHGIAEHRNQRELLPRKDVGAEGSGDESGDDPLVDVAVEHGRADGERQRCRVDDLLPGQRQIDAQTPSRYGTC